jgi:hypothetical protein
MCSGIALPRVEYSFGVAVSGSALPAFATSAVVAGIALPRVDPDAGCGSSDGW